MNQWNIIAEDGCLMTFDDIIHAYQQKIYMYILRLTGSQEDAEDLTQEVFIAVYEKKQQYQNFGSLQSWIYRIAKSKAIDKMRRYRQLSQIISRLFQDNSYEENKFEHHNEYDQRTESALARLRPEEKSILVLRSVEEMTYKEIAQIYQLSEVNIRKRYERAKKKFSDIYQNESEVEDYDRCTD